MRRIAFRSFEQVKGVREERVREGLSLGRHLEARGQGVAEGAGEARRVVGMGGSRAHLSPAFSSGDRNGCGERL